MDDLTNRPAPDSDDALPLHCAGQLLAELARRPAAERIDLLRRIFVPDIEATGFQLAPLLDTQVVASVFILATDVDRRLKSLHDKTRAGLS